METCFYSRACLCVHVYFLNFDTHDPGQVTQAGGCSTRLGQRLRRGRLRPGCCCCRLGLSLLCNENTADVDTDRYFKFVLVHFSNNPLMGL